MQKKKQTKSIILITIIVIILLLIMFSEDIIKLQNKNKIGLSENAEQELTNTTNESNIPKLSAGMIPIKWDGDYWTITTKEDNTWYNYANNQSAYIMLNDGTYQSELIRDMEGKKLAEQNIGAQIQETELGTIFVWIPRFAYNDNNEEINYIKDTGTAEEGWTIPELFGYKQDETKPDFILTGAWVEKEIDTNATSKIKEMNKEEGTYGFLEHTKATKISTNEITELQKYTLANTLEDITNKNRITLKIIDENKQEPIKAKGEYSKETGVITIQVTYSQYGIKQILLEQTTELSITKTNRTATADTTGIGLEDGINTITIIDNQDNKKELKIQVISAIYATVYEDKTLAFGKTENPLPEKQINKKFGDITEISEVWTLWRYYYPTTVNFVDKISPISTDSWFNGQTELTTIENISNLDTSNVTTMRDMFYNCSKLTELDLSDFDTSNVTDMWYMFSGCKGLTKLDVSNFDTSNVVNMRGMFEYCSSLTELDVSNFNTSKVTDMRGMFRYCSSLTELDVSKFNTSKVTDMCQMFYDCSSLTELDLSNFDTSSVTDMSYMLSGCKGLTELDVSNFDTRKVTDMSVMFRWCTSLTKLDLSKFNTSNVTDMDGMFYACKSIINLDLSSFDTSNAINMRDMFMYCTNLKTIYVGEKWSTSQAYINDMFGNCGTSSVTRK